MTISIDKLQIIVCLTILPIDEVICMEGQDYFWIKYWMGDCSRQS